MKILLLTILVLGVGSLHAEEPAKTIGQAWIEAGDKAAAQRAAESAALQQEILMRQVIANQQKQIELQEKSAKQQDYRSREISEKLDALARGEVIILNK